MTIQYMYYVYMKHALKSFLIMLYCASMYIQNIDATPTHKHTDTHACTHSHPCTHMYTHAHTAYVHTFLHMCTHTHAGE